MKNHEINNEIDLTNPQIYATQKHNIEIFRRKSLMGRYGSISFGIVGLLFFIMKFFYKVNIFKQYPYSSYVYAVSIIFAVLGTIIFARCPHCNSLQKAKSIAIFPWSVQYFSGYFPWASRCMNCSYYLSLKTLNKDFKIQTSEVENEN